MATPFAWQIASPAARGLDPARLAAWQEGLAARGTQFVIVTRHDRIVHEWYAPDWPPERPHYSASLAKAIVGGLSLILAMGDDLLTPDEPAARLIPAWQGDPLRERITIRHLATHSSGIEDAETPGKGHMDQGGWKEAFWRRDPDPFTVARDQAPVVFPPGTSAHYSNPGMAMLAYAVTAALAANTEHTNIRGLLADRVFRRIGVEDGEWSVGYDQTYTVDGLPLVANWGGAAFTARALARIGRLMLHRGEWLGAGQVLPAYWVDQAVTYAGTPADRHEGSLAPLSGLCWWTNADGAWPNVPRDAFCGAGAGNQMLLVVPSLDLVVARCGATLGDPQAGEGFWEGAVHHLFDPLMAAIECAPAAPAGVATACPGAARDAATAAPCPPSPVFRGVRFAPPSDIIRLGEDSDNWPLTWGDDNLLYTAYGDGFGFEPSPHSPRVERKLSLGFGAVAGIPPDLAPRNIRSETGERLGDGAAGLKASGLLMVDGVLYLWARNAGNACLAWSADHAETWEWADWRITESFGCPTFLNYGRNYEGARDGYVYVYSQDGPGAYEPYDQVVLARVPRGRLTEREAYTFFAGLDASGAPRWTPLVVDRAPVFSYPGRCQRLDVVYHPETGRYLMALGYNHRGGWGIYDAPEPWGPWTTVFHTHYWRLGNTHYYRLPSKWIVNGGRTIWMVFSGRTYADTIYDAMCVRKVELDF